MKFSTKDGVEVTLDAINEGLKVRKPDFKGNWTSEDIMDLVLSKDYLIDGSNPMMDWKPETYSKFDNILEVMNFLNNFGDLGEV